MEWKTAWLMFLLHETQTLTLVRQLFHNNDNNNKHSDSLNQRSSPKQEFL